MAGAVAVSVAAVSTSDPSSSINNCLSFENRLLFSRRTPTFLWSKAKPLSKSLKLVSSQIPAHSTPPPSRSLPLVRSLLPLSRFRSISEEIEASIDDGDGESKAEPEMEPEPELELMQEEVEAKRRESNSLVENKLFVGNLPFSTTSFELIDMFKEAGAIRSAQIIYDRMTGRSRGFAFVTMETLEEANTAIRMFDKTVVGRRPLRVKFAEVPRGRDRNVLSPKTKETENSDFVDSPHKIYVYNLSWHLTSKGLKEVFSSQPGFLSAKVAYEWVTGRSLGFGFVSFSSAEEAEAAVNSMNGREVEGRPMRLNTALMQIARSESSSSPSSPSVGSHGTTEQQEESMGTEGEVVSSLSSSPMSSVAESEQEKSVGTMVVRRPLRVNFAEVPRGGDRKVLSPKIKETENSDFVDSPHKIYVYNLSWYLTSKGLKDVFSSQPGFLSAKVEYEWVTGRSLGFGFVSFSSAEAAEAAVNSMNGREVEGRPMRLNTALMQIARSESSSSPSSLSVGSHGTTEQHEESMGTEGEIVSSLSSSPMSSVAESEQEKSVGTESEVVSSSPSSPISSVAESEQVKSMGTESEVVSSSSVTPLSSMAESEQEKSVGTKSEVVSSVSPMPSMAESEQEKSMGTESEAVSSSPPTSHSPQHQFKIKARFAEGSVHKEVSIHFSFTIEKQTELLSQ